MNAPSKVAKAENGNLRIWDALSKTDPEQTKAFTRSGGFKGTAIKPIWVVRRLTEHFGPCGVGWGIGEPQFQVVPCEGEVMVYCTVECWHNNGVTGANQVATLYGVGGDKVQAKRSSGVFCDDEAFKKAFTDAVNNAFKFIGVAADIHMGLFDDNKYVEAMREEFDEPKREKVPGITKIKERLRVMQDEGADCADAEAFSALVKANRDDLKTIRDANHSWWTGDGGDEFEGFQKWIARRREELAPPSEAYAMLKDTLAQCTSMDELNGWFKLNSKYVETLDGEESREIVRLYDEKEAALKSPETVGDDWKTNPVSAG